MTTDRPIISIRLKQARTAKGISQKKLGELVGIDPFSASSRMNHYEVGRHVPDFSLLKKVAKVLDVPVPYFYCEDNKLAALLLAIGYGEKATAYELLKSIMP